MIKCLIYLVVISPKREIPKRDILKRSYFWRFSVARSEDSPVAKNIEG